MSLRSRYRSCFVLLVVIAISFFGFRPAANADNHFHEISEIAKDFRDRMELATSPLPFSGMLEQCGSTLDRYRVHKDGLFVLPSDFRWSDLSEQEKKECSEDAARIVASHSLDLARSDIARYSKIVEGILDDALDDFSRMVSVAKLIDEFNESEGFLRADDFRTYEQAILSNAFSNYSPNALAVSVKPAIDQIIWAQERRMNATQELNAPVEDVRNMIGDLGNFVFAARTMQSAQVGASVDGSTLGVRLTVDGIPSVGTTEIRDAETGQTFGLRNFDEIVWNMPTMSRPEVNSEALERARRIVSFRSCNRAGGAGACCGHIHREEICFLRVCGTEYNKPVIYKRYCQGVSSERPNPLEGCTNFPSEDDPRPSCQ